MGTFRDDIKFGVRQLGKNPGFTLVMVLVLSLGISVSVTRFGLVEWRLHPPSPFSDSPCVVHLCATDQATEKEDFSYLDFLTLREPPTLLSGLAAVRRTEMAVRQALGVCLLLFAAAFLACYLPARRAARIDPMAALRYE